MEANSIFLRILQQNCNPTFFRVPTGIDDVTNKVIEACMQGKQVLEGIWHQLGIDEDQQKSRKERFFDLIASKLKYHFGFDRRIGLKSFQKFSSDFHITSKAE